MSLFKPKIEPSVIYAELKALAANRPECLQFVDDRGQLQQDVQSWLGRLSALLEASGELIDTARLRTETGQLRVTVRDRGYHAEGEIWAIFERALARAELAAPVAVQGAFIPVGGHFDSFAALAKILGSANKGVFIVDPYLDETVLTDFLALISEMVPIRLLGDEAGTKSSLKPAVSRWSSQFGDARPVEARLTLPRKLHDRLIVIDESEVWIVTQSFKDLAARAPGSIEKANAESGSLKIDAYASLWAGANPI